MNKQHEKLQRLLNLTATLLQSRLPLSAQELREKLPNEEAYSFDKSKAAFRRTFERDKKDLRSIGVPIEVREWKYADASVDRYFIDVSVYSERDLRFEPDEIAALNLAYRRVHLPGTAEAFIKTGLASQKELEELYPAGQIEAASPEAELPFDERVSKLASAVAKRRSVKYCYRDSRGSPSDREVEPWRLSFNRGHWYLVAWDLRRAAERLFRIDRIQGEVAEAGPATHPIGKGTDPTEMKPWDYGTDDPLEAELLVDGAIAPWAQQMVGVAGEPQPDGSLLLKVPVRSRDGFRSFVFDMLDHAEVLGPPEMRDHMTSWLKALL